MIKPEVLDLQDKVGGKIDAMKDIGQGLDKSFFKNKFYELLIFVLEFIFFILVKNFVPDGLSNIQSRQYLGWIGIGNYGGLMVYVIGVLIYKKWKNNTKK